MKGLLLCIIAFGFAQSSVQDSPVLLSDSDESLLTRNSHERKLDEGSASAESSEETRDVNSNTFMFGETVDSDTENAPKFKLDSKSMDSTEERIGEIEEMKQLEGKDLLRTVPNALHHRVVFPMVFPHVGMPGYSSHVNLKNDEAHQPAEE